MEKILPLTEHSSRQTILKKIIIISYTFPPYPGIGGRRWAKFAKYLALEGWEVHVIAAKRADASSESLWTADVAGNRSIIVHRVRDLYPRWLLRAPGNIFHKVLYRFSLGMVRALTRGTPFDRGVFWNRAMVWKASELIKRHSVNNVVVSAAPFSSAYASLALKRRFCNINLMVDLRDPWTWGALYGIKSISQRRLFEERRREAAVVQGADKVIVPADAMHDHLCAIYSLFCSKIVVLPHGFDDQEVKIKSSRNDDCVKIVFYGTLYDGLENDYRAIVSSLSATPRVRLDVYSDSKHYRYFFEGEETSANLGFYSPVAPAELFSKASAYDFVLIVQPKYAMDFITTKIYEIVYARLPIIMVGEAGRLAKFLVDNNLGEHVLPSEIQKKFGSLHAWKKKPYGHDAFPIGDYSFVHLTKQLIRLLK